MKFVRKLQRHSAPEHTIVTTDVAPAISVDHNQRLVEGIQTLQEILGVTEMQEMPAGTQIKLYKVTQVNTPSQVGEGEDIPLTEIKRELASTIELSLKKYRKATTAEAIQKSGRDVALNMTDEKLLKSVQKDIKSAFFSAVQPVSGTTAADAGSTTQEALANIWAKAAVKFEDEDVEMIYFIHPNDVASYLASAAISVQNKFGFKYVEDFLGLGSAFITPSVTENAPFGVPKENLNGAFAPIGGDVAAEFGLTSDATGLVGTTHSANKTNASIETLIMSNVVFYVEDLSAIIKGAVNFNQPSVTIDTTLTEGDISDISSIYGVTMNEVQSDVVAHKKSITGTSKYLESVNTFDMSLGHHFLILHITSTDADTIKASMEPSQTSGLVELDASGVVLFQMKDDQSQKVKIVLTKNGVDTVKLYNIGNMTFEAEA